ncbi:MAG: hypothetical protein ACRDRN_17150 [Sciscionella sp.]
MGPGWVAVCLRAAVPSVLFLAWIACGVYLAAFHHAGVGIPMLIVSLLAFLIAVPVLARTPGAIALAVIGGALYFAAVLTTGSAFVQDLVLSARGQHITAVVASTHFGYSARPSERYCLSTLGGKPLSPCLAAGSGDHYRRGDHVAMVVDPRGDVDMAKQADMRPALHIGILGFGALCVIGTFTGAALVWRRKRGEVVSPFEAATVR